MLHVQITRRLFNFSKTAHTTASDREQTRAMPRQWKTECSKLSIGVKWCYRRDPQQVLHGSGTVVAIISLFAPHCTSKNSSSCTLPTPFNPKLNKIWPNHQNPIVYQFFIVFHHFPYVKWSFWGFTPKTIGASWNLNLSSQWRCGRATRRGSSLFGRSLGASCSQ